MQWHTINFKPVYREIESKWNRKVNTPQFLANSWNPEPNIYYDMRQNALSRIYHIDESLFNIFI